MDPAWKAEYQACLPAATEFARRVPLVRVVIPGRKDREETEIDDVLKQGRLRTTHQSQASAQLEDELNVRRSLYFHAGRTHPDYGKMVLVFRPMDEEAKGEATPFGIGGLLCTRTGPYHAAGQCTSPVAHDPKQDQVAFVADSCWATDWREKAAHFLAAFFSPSLDCYFLPADQGKPRRADGAGIYSDAHSRDWRSWTIEVRLLEDVELTLVLRRDGVQAWAMDEQLEDRLRQRAQATGVMFPWWEELMRSQARRVAAAGATIAELFKQIDEEVKDQCLR